MSYPNYLNGIPSSLVGYGNQRQQFQSYDGILSTASNAVSRFSRVSKLASSTLDTLEKRLTALDAKLTSLTTTLYGFGIQPGNTGSLSVDNVSTNDVKTQTLASGSHTVNTLSIDASEGTGIVMNDRGIRFRGSGDTNHIILYQYDPGSGFDGLEVRGNTGGALGYMKNGTRKACMDWGSERIRSHKTFQAGYVLTDATTGTISFQTEFETPPCVFATVYGESGNYLFFITIYEVTKTNFKYKKRFLDGANLYNSTNEDWGWVAFDPTNTSIF